MAVGSYSKKFEPVKGVRLAATACGIKAQGSDLVLMEFCEGSRVAGVFTKSWFAAAPVIVSKKHMELAQSRFFLVNSGNANAATGERGEADALSCCQSLAGITGVKAQEVLPFSTGVIGENLEIDKIQSHLNELTSSLDENKWLEAAEGILTTDTRPKIGSRKNNIEGKEITITGMAKGSGMIQPDMATLLVYIATDARIEQEFLQSLLLDSVTQSFNRVTVDSDTSTNDSCMLIATGASGITIEPESNACQLFASMLTELCIELAKGIIKDAEGATRFTEVQIVNGASVEACLDVAYSVANSPLVKSAIFAGDANWGRIVMAIGKSATRVNASKTDIYLGDLCLMKQGEKAPGYKEADGAIEMAKEEICITVDLNDGNASEIVWTSDLSYDYIKINAEYRT